MSQHRHQKRFRQKLESAVDQNNSLLCVGLDPDLTRFPAHLRELEPGQAIRSFSEQIVAATSDLVCAYKPNFAFYLAHGIAGIEALLDTRRLIPPEVPVILDCKIGDISNTAAAYARGFFDAWDFDAITVNPYMGRDSFDALFRHPSRGLFVVCKTSNPGSGDFQDQTVCRSGKELQLYRRVAQAVSKWDLETESTLGLVAGATFPEELAFIRADCPGLPILVPGIGSQHGDLPATVTAGLDANTRGLLISSSRAIIHAGAGHDYAKLARQAAFALRDQINTLRQAVHAGIR